VEVEESSGPANDGRPLERGDLFSALTRELIALHKRFYGRGATRARAMFAHPQLLLVEMEDIFLTVEHTMVERGQLEIVRQARQTFHGALRDEFIEAVERLTGRPVENYESVTFTAPDRVLEIFYLGTAEEETPSESAPSMDGASADGRPG
jgi:uncharacterized protein YbcI